MSAVVPEFWAGGLILPISLEPDVEFSDIGIYLFPDRGANAYDGLLDGAHGCFYRLDVLGISIDNEFSSYAVIHRPSCPSSATRALPSSPKKADGRIMPVSRR